MMHIAKIIEIDEDLVKKYCYIKYGIKVIYNIKCGIFFNGKKFIEINYYLKNQFQYITEINKYIEYDDFLLFKRKEQIEKLKNLIK